MSQSPTFVAQAPRAAKLGEELPIFCERCGYSLFGLPPIRCDHCGVMQFQCPECGHHQPLNTLRPAFQKVLGRFRAGAILGSLLFRLFAIAMALIGWFAMGIEWTYRYSGTYSSRRGYYMVPREADLEQVIAFGIFGLFWGIGARMMLLRWRRGYLVGMVLGGLAVAAIILGAYTMKWERLIVASPWNGTFAGNLAIAFLTTILGASIVWGIWWTLVHTFLPRRTAQSFLAWQEGLSQRASELARE